MAPPAASWQPTEWGGGPTQGGAGGLGYNPQVPLPTATLPGTTAGNMGGLGGLYGLSGSLNQFNIGQAAEPLKAGLPDYTKMVGQSSANIGSMLRGEVPSDVLNEILQTGAERGIMTGMPGSPNSNAAMLRALGLTSLGLQQTGEQELTGAIARTPQAPLFNPAQFLVTPAQQQEAAVANALYGAAPNPTAVAQSNLAAARGGLGAGLGSVSPVGVNIPNYGSFAGATPSVFPSMGTGTNYGGETYYGGATPSTFDNAAWLASIGVSPGAGAGAAAPTATGTSMADEYWNSLWNESAPSSGGYTPDEQGYPVDETFNPYADMGSFAYGVGGEF